MFLKVGVRNSRLSLTQTDHVVDRIRQKNPGLKIDRKIIESSSDRDSRRSLFFLELKGSFDREVDEAVSEGRIDFAVHNMKDVPVSYRNTRLVIACVPERGSPAEVLVSDTDMQLKDLPKGSRIGTSSPIRVAQLRRARPDVKPEPLFGNVETRIERMDRGEFDAVILAEAGLARLGMAERISERLSIDDFIPAPGQGALAIVARRDNLKVIETLMSIEDPATRAEINAERELVRSLEETSKVPVAGLAEARGDRIQIRACILSVDGKERVFAQRTGLTADGLKLAHEMREELVANGASRIEETWRNAHR
ncbi:MAG TPA: hydroxymethylbilane synthase [Candidatus Bathyarchaeia archaeon]|nr:hydroxymethylbilane synthase [Candidatus Bathyarchaeia archaeon]